MSENWGYQFVRALEEWKENASRNDFSRWSLWDAWRESKCSRGEHTNWCGHTPGAA